jgi:transcription initiation factor TFIIE subunit alpha
LIEAKIRDRLQFEQNNYFFFCINCEDSNKKYNFDEAFELNFRCPDCGGSLEAQDNKEIIEFLKNKIALSGKTKISID